MELLSEEEQWERLKAWLRSNGPSILIMVVVMVAGFYGWKWWQGRAAQDAVAAAAVYDNILQNFDEEKVKEGMALIETLRSEHPDSPYVTAADMVAAKVFVITGELDKAAERLERVMNTAEDEELRPIARLRLARVQAEKGDHDKALATLGTAAMGPHEAARLEARGDVLLAKGDRAAALAEYEAARKLLSGDEAGAQGTGEVLDLKIADLGGPTAAAEAPATAEAAPAAEAPATTESAP